VAICIVGGAITVVERVFALLLLLPVLVLTGMI
jgi:hypothetical protein